jgi:YXWGXW repeat-containing protein
MKLILPAFLLLAMGVAFGQVSVGISIGPPPPSRVIHAHPGAPGPDYFWVDGYWYPDGHRYRWHDGYWTRAPYAGAHWVAPRYEGSQWFEGYWEGERGRIRHDHRWDHDRDRDWHHDHDRDHDRDRDRH